MCLNDTAVHKWQWAYQNGRQILRNPVLLSMTTWKQNKTKLPYEALHYTYGSYLVTPFFKMCIVWIQVHDKLPTCLLSSG